jgi:hypothetical protein
MPQTPRLAIHGEPTPEDVEVSAAAADAAIDRPSIEPDPRPETPQASVDVPRETQPVSPQRQAKDRKTGPATAARKPNRAARGTGAAPAATPAPTPPHPGLEPDEGIDWTVPPFPEAAPTGTPDAPSRNPIVIDEPPAR